jgi:hypothetical protein
VKKSTLALIAVAAGAYWLWQRRRVVAAIQTVPPPSHVDPPDHWVPNPPVKVEPPPEERLAVLHGFNPGFLTGMGMLGADLTIAPRNPPIQVTGPGTPGPLLSERQKNEIQSQLGQAAGRLPEKERAALFALQVRLNSDPLNQARTLKEIDALVRRVGGTISVPQEPSMGPAPGAGEMAFPTSQRVESSAQMTGGLKSQEAAAELMRRFGAQPDQLQGKTEKELRDMLRKEQQGDRPPATGGVILTGGETLGPITGTGGGTRVVQPWQKAALEAQDQTDWFAKYKEFEAGLYEGRRTRQTPMGWGTAVPQTFGPTYDILNIPMIEAQSSQEQPIQPVSYLQDPYWWLYPQKEQGYISSGEAVRGPSDAELNQVF